MDLAGATPVLDQCLRRIRRWRVPPNWTPADWAREMKAESAGAFWSACRDFDPSRRVPTCRDFDPSRRVPFEAFARQRILGAALTRYRREWGFALHCGGDDERPRPREAPDTVACSDRAHLVREVLARLTSSELTLIDALFWSGETERVVAGRLSLTQQAVSKRKRVLLRTLKRLLAGAVAGVELLGPFV